MTVPLEGIRHRFRYSPRYSGRAPHVISWPSVTLPRAADGSGMWWPPIRTWLPSTVPLIRFIEVEPTNEATNVLAGR